MDIFEFAMEKEKYAEQYYRELADKADHAGLKKILTMLAEDEVRHYQAVERMKSDAPGAITETPALAGAKEVFEKMRRGAEKFDFHISEVDLYRKARDIEAEGKKFYLQKVQEVEDPGQKEILKKLAEEEDKHLMLVQSLCDFVSTPETFLENAEFSHFDDYVDGEF
ncbi:MAG: ferritin-like domain-containing protein [Planctomycetota bacterium]|jgi:rubrerythrin